MPIKVNILILVTLICMNSAGYNAMTVKIWYLSLAVFVNLQGLLCYWFMSNVVSLIQAVFLKIPRIRQALNIPVMVASKVDPAAKKPFIKSIKESEFFII